MEDADTWFTLMFTWSVVNQVTHLLDDADDAAIYVEDGGDDAFAHLHSVLVERPHQNGRLSCARLTHTL